MYSDFPVLVNAIVAPQMYTVTMNVTLKLRICNASAI